jgi:hypothetical protein
VGRRLLEDVIKLIQTGTAVTVAVETENVHRQRISQLNIQQATCHFKQKNISHVYLQMFHLSNFCSFGSHRLGVCHDRVEHTTVY